jgi:hypothetical protein
MGIDANIAAKVRPYLFRALWGTRRELQQPQDKEVLQLFGAFAFQVHQHRLKQHQGNRPQRKSRSLRHNRLRRSSKGGVIDLEISSSPSSPSYSLPQLFRSLFFRPNIACSTSFILSCKDTCLLSSMSLLSGW